ncbi:MAG: OmpA family protein [Bacteroidetes bacterium]|jgi:OOP family OmpA-OmpF porin|nr:OmpA family protein [Bacteroidota bacterium]
MKPFKIYLYVMAFACLAITMQSCKPKKMIAKSTPPAETEAKPVTKPAPPAPAPVKAQPAAVKVIPPDFNFKNIQFDYNSAVLRTDGIQYLDHIADEMKKDQSARFILNGHASSEGTVSHNMQLSIDRANAVKQYLVNAGIDGSHIQTKGYGAKKPIASNKTEKGRQRNRRVEVKLIK